MRSANAIVMVLAILILVFAMVWTAAARVQEFYLLGRVERARQTAVAAAEAVASFREARLVEVAASNDLQKLNQNPDTGRKNYAGVEYVADSVWEGVQFFGSCVVRWRVEPGRVIDPDSGKYTTNPPLTVAAKPTDANWVDNSTLYHYRILTQAFALDDRQRLDSTSIKDLESKQALPWQAKGVGSAVASVQAERVIQMSVDALFRYALLYTATGRDGDMDINNGPVLVVRGRVHANGAVFLGPQGTRKQNNPIDASKFTGDYGAGDKMGDLFIGSQAEPADLTGYDGVFGIRKLQMYMARRDTNFPAGTVFVPKTDPSYGDKVWFGDGSQDPLPDNPSFPIPASLGDGNQWNLNYDYTNRWVNDTPFSPAEDSRNGVLMAKTHGNAVRDNKQSKAQLVRTLSNIAELGGRPFEAERLVADGTPIYTLNPGNPQDIASWTIIPNDPPAPYCKLSSPGLVLSAGVLVPDLNDTQRSFVEFSSDPIGHEPVAEVAHRLYFSKDPVGQRAYLGNNSYDTDATGNQSSLAQASLLASISTADPGNPGKLRNREDLNPQWIVDAGGLKRYYQRVNAQNAADIRGRYPVDGKDRSESSLMISDLFDPDPHYIGNPTTGLSGATDIAMPKDYQPGDPKKWRYHGPAGLPRAGSSTCADWNGDTFADNAVLNPYLQWAWYSNPGDSSVAGKYGLTIRERAYQVLPTDPAQRWAGFPWRPQLSAGADAAGRALWAQDYKRYLKSQYIVHFGSYLDTATGRVWPLDITSSFLDFVGTGAQPQDTGSELDFVISEQDIIDNRQMSAQQYFLWDTYPSVIPDPVRNVTPSIYRKRYRDYRVNTLTVHMAKVLEYLRSTPYGSVNANTSTYVSGIQAARTLADLSHGMVYMSRYRRSDGYTPWEYTRFHPRARNLWQVRLPACINIGAPYGATGTLDEWLKNHQKVFSTGMPSLPTFALGFDWREGVAPAMAHTAAVRLRTMENINTGRIYDDGVVKSVAGLSVISANSLYLWGDINTTRYGNSTSGALGTAVPLEAASKGSGELLKGSLKWEIAGVKQTHEQANTKGYKLPPVAIYCDSVSHLSTAWKDEAQNAGAFPRDAYSTCMFASIITGNTPVTVDGRGFVLESGGPHNLLRYLESWKDKYHHTLGSVVCINPSLYNLGVPGNEVDIPGLADDANAFYIPPTRDWNMNSDLFSRSGQPPFSPFGIQVVRTVSTVQALGVP